MGKELLTITTLEKERDFVTIDEKPYPVMYFDDFGLMEQARLNRFGKTIEDLQDNKLSDGDVKIAIAKLRELISMIVPDMPAEILTRLTDNQQQAIATAFLAEKREKEEQRAKQRQRN
jgi:hypothetical protein